MTKTPTRELVTIDGKNVVLQRDTSPMINGGVLENQEALRLFNIFDEKFQPSNYGLADGKPLRMYDAKTVKIDLSKVPEDVKKMVFAVTIHEADTRGQNFGQVSNAYMRVMNDAGGAELAKYDLSEDASTETAMIFGEIYRHNGEWKMKAIGAGFAGGLGPLATAHGVNVG